MSNIHVNRNRQSLGQYTPKELAEGLATGELLPTDLGWQEPMETWQPLSEFKDLPVVEVPAGGLDLSKPIHIDPIPPVLIALEPAWERRKETGFFRAVAETTRQVFAEPAATFAKMKLSGGLGTPLGFYVLVASFSGIVAMLYQLAVFLVNPEAAMAASAKEAAEVTKVLTDAGLSQYATAYTSMTSGGLSKEVVLAKFGINIFLIPFIATISPFLMAGIYHGFLLLVGGAKKPFEVSFRVVCYGAGAISLLQIIPVCGQYIVGIWTLVTLVIGLKCAHQTDFTRAALAILLPVICCCGLIFGLGVLGAAAMGGALK